MGGGCNIILLVAIKAAQIKLFFVLTAISEGILPSNLLAPVIGGAIGGLILLIFVITVIVVVSATLVRRRGSSHNLKRIQSKDKDISKIQSLSLVSMLFTWINH